jgi:outer membrane protein OmpA-like peptidoglycan-associated protein
VPLDTFALAGTKQLDNAPGPSVIVATAFVVHFWFDKAFIEPCLRPVLKQVADHAAAHPDEKLVIVGCCLAVADRRDLVLH